MSRETYTVREVASIISGSHDPKVIERVVRQLRYWTNEGVITPIGGKHTGSGRYREYNPHEVRKAAVTAELVRHGVSIARLDPFGEYLDGILGDFEDRSNSSEQDNFYLAHSEELAEDGGAISIIGSDNRSPLRVVERWDISNPDSLAKTDFMNYPTCLIINLTKLFSRLNL